MVMPEDSHNNVDLDVTEGFGHEWSSFPQRENELNQAEREDIFQGYFRIFPWNTLPSSGGIGADIGCGSGRWAVIVAKRVAHLHLLDASARALAVARENLIGSTNVSFHLASVGDIPLPAASLDFAYSLGVLHHVPDTQAAIDAVASKLKPGAPFLIYLYYAFDNRPRWYRGIWYASNIARVVIARLPPSLRFIISQFLAATIYWPLARTARLLEILGLSTPLLPLHWYRTKSFYVMRTDAYDRFCTSLERRFTRAEIEKMLQSAGFKDIRFSAEEPYWCAVAIKR
jgi:ubiquinone/menaquinone biosynthesis C-methylase UbiE